MLHEPGFCLFPRVLSGLWVIGLAVITEKAMGRAGVDLHVVRLPRTFDGLLDLLCLFNRDERVLVAEEAEDRVLDLPRKVDRRAGRVGRNPAAVERDRSLEVIRMLGRRQEGELSPPCRTP